MKHRKRDHLLDRLWQSLLEQAAHQVNAAMNRLDSIVMHRLEGEGRMAWMETYREIMEILEAMARAEDPEDLTAGFRSLSEQQVQAVRTYY